MINPYTLEELEWLENQAPWAWTLQEWGLVAQYRWHLRYKKPVPMHLKMGAYVLERKARNALATKPIDIEAPLRFHPEQWSNPNFDPNPAETAARAAADELIKRQLDADRIADEIANGNPSGDGRVGSSTADGPIPTTWLDVDGFDEPESGLSGSDPAGVPEQSPGGNDSVSQSSGTDGQRPQHKQLPSGTDQRSRRHNRALV